MGVKMSYSCFSDTDKVNNKIEPHPLANTQKVFESLSPWVLVDGYCAMRYRVGEDPEVYGSRVAFIEKTARVRLLTEEEQWEAVNKDSEYGLCEESLIACDIKLTELGFK